MKAGVDQMKSACLRDPNEGAVIDVAAQMPLGEESDLIPGGSLPAKSVYGRMHLGEEVCCRDGVSVLDGSSFTQEDIGSVEVGARERFCDGIARVDVIGLDPYAEGAKTFSSPLVGGAVFLPVPGVSRRFAGVGGVT